MLKQRPFLIEALTAIGLILAPFILPQLGLAPNTINRILVWGLFGIGFDLLARRVGVRRVQRLVELERGGELALLLGALRDVEARAELRVERLALLELSARIR